MPTKLKIFSSNLNTCRNIRTRTGILDYLQTHKPDIWLMQEVNISTEELNTLVDKFGYRANCNVQIENENSRGTAFVWSKSLELRNILTIEECRIQTATIGNLNLMNIYAPSGSENKFARREMFGQNVMRLYQSSFPNLPLTGGDYNCVLNAIDTNKNAGQKKCEALRNLVNAFNMTDIFRHLYPNSREYTFHRADSASRLDRFYAPQFLIPLIQSVQHLPQPYSDHCLIETILNVPDIQKIDIPRPYRNSYWKMNAANIDEDFMDNVEIVYLKAKDSINKYTDIADWWDCKCKPMLRMLCKNYSISKARERKCTKDFLFYQLKNALNFGPYKEVLRLKAEINKILLFEANGFKIRSKHKEDLEMEKASLYHINREIKKGKENNAETLMIGEKVETDPRKCKEEVMRYFSALFSGRLGIDGEVYDEPFEMDEEYLEDFLNDDVSKLSDIESYKLEEAFSMIECQRSS